VATERKTRKTTANVAAYIKKAAPGERGEDCKAIVKMMEKATGDKVAMWGPAIIGAGSWDLVYANGDSLEWPEAAMSVRTNALTIYGMKESPTFATLIKKLGKHKMGGGCLYIKKLADVDTNVLEEMISTSVSGFRAKQKAKLKAQKKAKKKA
jgi:hypothetical protein